GGDVRQRGPRLLAVDDVVSALADRPRPETGQVGARLGLGIALGPVVLGAKDGRQPRLLLLLRPEPHDHRADLDHAVLAVLGSAPPLVLLAEDDLLDRAQSHAAPLDRPAGRDPTSLAQVVDPLALLGTGQPGGRVAEVRRIVLLNVRANQCAELVVVERVPVAFLLAGHSAASPASTRSE